MIYNIKNYKNWLFAVEGSPTIQTLMSPLKEIPYRVFLFTPPNNINKIPFLISSKPQTDGAIDWAIAL